MKNSMHKNVFEKSVNDYTGFCRYTTPDELKDIIRSPYIKDELKAILIRVLENKTNERELVL